MEQQMELVEIKKEPPVEFVLSLSPATDDRAAPQYAEEIVAQMRASKKLASSTIVFKCDLCDYQTITKLNWTRHMGTHNKPFRCETCEKTFATKENLKNHQMHHKHGIYATALDATFDCATCEKSYSTPSYLRKHQATVHKEVECEVCKKIFKNRYYKQKHHSQVHGKVKSSICRKGVSKRSAANHMQSHSVENHFECDLCAYKSKQKTGLVCHINSTHRNASKRNDGRNISQENVHQVPEPQETHTESQQVNEIPTNSNVQPRLFGDPHDSSSEPVAQLQMSKSSFMQSFNEQIDQIPPPKHLHFQRKLMAFLGDYFEKHVE